MSTGKKHIAVYLEPVIEKALVAFCEHEDFKSKKGFMYSAAVNAILADFFCVPLTKTKECACDNTTKHIQPLSTEFMMSPPFYQLTTAQAYSYYLTGDITAKGLITFYLKIHQIRIQDIWGSARLEEDLRAKVGLEKTIFYYAFMDLYAQHEKTIDGNDTATV